jgi:hypothetical protein
MLGGERAWRAAPESAEARPFPFAVGRPLRRALSGPANLGLPSGRSPLR